MKFTQSILFIVFFIVALQVNANKEEERLGSYILKNYSSKEHGGNAQIFGVAQDSRGVMYFANQKGVLEYNGDKWNTIFIGKDERQVHSILKNNDGRILVGAEGDFGILSPDSTGQIYFESMLVSSGIDSVQGISRMYLNGSRLLMKAENEILVLDEMKLENRFTSVTRFSSVSFANGITYASQVDLGLFHVVEGELQMVPNGDFFKDKFICELIEYQDKLLIVTDSDGLYYLEENGSIKLASQLNSFRFFNAYSFENELFLGTFSHGTIKLNSQLEVVAEIGLEKGIPDATVRCHFFDEENNYWIGTNVGISKISVNDPVLKYGKKSGLTGGVEAIIRFVDGLYLATQNGVYSLKSNETVKIPGLERDCYGIRSLQYGNDTLLFIAEANKVTAVDRNENLFNVENGGPYDFIRSPIDTNDLIVLHWDGISKVRYNNGNFSEIRYLQSFGGSAPFNFIVDPDGTIWIGTLNEEPYGVIKGHIDMFDQENPQFEWFGKGTGLPQGASYLFKKDEVLYVANDLGLFEFDGENFHPASKFGIDFTEEQYGVHRINEDPEGNVWMILFDRDNNYQYGFSSLTSEGYVWNSIPFKRYATEIVHSIYHEEDVTWLGGPAGLLRFDRRKDVNYHHAFNSVISKVKFGTDILYGGTSYDNSIQSVELDYSSNKSISFEFSCTSFIDEESNLFSFYMEGHDEDWSEWSSRKVKEYNLDYGTYTFHVKALNIYGTESSEAIYSIRVLPPWYHTWWAYALYVVLGLLLIYSIIRLSVYRIRQKNLQLEKIIEERTQEVVVQKEEAEKQRDEAEKQKKIADDQKMLVEEKNKEIVDSINYAKRIQEAIMPSLSDLQEVLPELFLYYLPKDLVAGDFFWMEKVGDVVYYAAADCTGHGVPGAMVSVVCSNALTKALLEDGIRETGPLLDRTREIVIERFARSGEEVKDGMDISICALNIKTNDLQWSGANNPIWIIRNETDFIEETKADKQPIGLFDRAQPFTTHNFQLEKGDLVYVFTDGYQDQFGGEKGKKFKPKNVKQLLIDSRNGSMEEQKELLGSTFITWMRDLEQIDDVCMIGIRI